MNTARGYRGSKYAVNIFEDYFHRHEKTYFPVNQSQILLILYKGPNRDRLHKESIFKTKKWEYFFDRVIYNSYITREYKDMIGLPHGIVFNNRTNDIVHFDCHLELDKYFRDIH